jgi:SAM-dependent methyltransferase
MTSPTWFLDESAHAGPEHLDPAYVRGYDRKAAFDPVPDVEHLADLGLLEGGTVVDLGCGTGTFALTAAQRCRRVVAVDVSPVMLAAVKADIERTGTGNIEPVLAGFLTYDHQGEPADVVYTRNALHRLPDLWKAVALSRVAAMLRPGGVLYLRDLVFSFDPDQLERYIEPWLANAVEHPEDGWTREEYEVHLRQEHSTFAWLLEPMLERAGFDIRQAAHRESRIYAQYLCVRRPPD